MKHSNLLLKLFLLCQTYHFSAVAQVSSDKFFHFEVTCDSNDSSFCAYQATNYHLLMNGSDMLLQIFNSPLEPPSNRILFQEEVPVKIIDDEEEIVITVPLAVYANFDNTANINGGLIAEGDTIINGTTYLKKVYQLTIEGTVITEENVFLASATQVHSNTIVSRMFFPMLMQSGLQIPYLVRKSITKGNTHSTLTIRNTSETAISDFSVFDIPAEYMVRDFTSILR